MVCVSERTTAFSSQQIGDALYSCPDRPTVGWCGRNRWLASFGLWCGVHCGDKEHLDLVTNEQLWSDTLPATVQSDGDDECGCRLCHRGLNPNYEVGGAKAQRCASDAFSTLRAILQAPNAELWTL